MTVRDLSTASRVLAVITSTGGNATRLNSVNLSINDDSQLLRDARARAFNDAKDRAQQFADLSGLKLGNVLSIAEVPGAVPPMPVPMPRGPMADAAVSAVPIDVEAFLHQVVSPYEAVAAERGLRLRLLTSAPPELVVKTDPLLLGRVLANLLDNSCKFTPAGGTVELRATYGPRGLVIAVADTGPGLPESERPRVFERFFRSASVRGSIEGFGLGLPLAQDLTRALGGQLYAAVVPVGAEFVVELPLRAESGPLPARAARHESPERPQAA